MVRDISARKEAENQLRKSEEKYRILYENALVGMATLDGNAEKLLECNEKFANIFDFNTTEKCLNEFDINSVNSDKFNISDLLTKFKKIENIELKTTKRTGETIWIEVSAYRNHLTGHIKMVVSDITQRRKMQQSLKESEEKYRLLVENGPSVFWITDKHANTIYISSNVEKVYGFSPEEIYQNRDLWINRIHEQDIEMVTNNFNSLFTENNKYDIIYRIKARKGNWIWLHEVGEKYVNEAGEEVAIGVFTDISETKRAQQKVLFAMINAEERERSRIAKDLHDGVSPVLSAIKLYIQSFNNTKEEELRTNLSQKIGSTIKEVINSIEEISKNISPHILQRFGLIAAVESFTNKINELGKVNLNIESKLSNRLPENIEITFYRITTELINNTLKYAKAQNIKIEYKQENEIVYFNYADDGVGFNIQEVLKNKTGMGIHNMKNRINALNGNFDMKLNENGGINIGISVSIDN
jgi:PAS domain S-box-containing protein